MIVGCCKELPLQRKEIIHFIYGIICCHCTTTCLCNNINNKYNILYLLTKKDMYIKHTYLIKAKSVVAEKKYNHRLSHM